jgi:hypothetical protein
MTEARALLKSQLAQAGLLCNSKRGRPVLYATREERLHALQEQQRLCNRRYAEKLKRAKEAFKAFQSDTHSESLLEQ